MQGRSGISNKTPERLVLDVGAAYLNIDIAALEDGSASDPFGDAIAGSGVMPLGGTRGGAVFNPNRSLRQIEADGQLGPTKGMIRRQSVAPTLELTLLELTSEQFQQALAGSASAAAGSFTKISGGPIQDGDFYTNLALAASYSDNDQPVVIVLENVLVMESPGLTTADEDEGTLSTIWTAHFDLTVPTTEPWAIYHPGATP